MDVTTGQERQPGRWWVVLWTVWGLVVGTLILIADRSPRSALCGLVAGVVVARFGWAFGMEQVKGCGELFKCFLPERPNRDDFLQRFRRGPIAIPLDQLFGAVVFVGTFHGILLGGLIGALASLLSHRDVTAGRGVTLGALIGSSIVPGLLIMGVMASGVLGPTRNKGRDKSGRERLIFGTMILLAPLLTWCSLLLPLSRRLRRPFRRRAMIRLEGIGARVGWDGEDRYHGVNLAGTGARDTDLGAVKALREIDSLNLADTRITDDGLVNLDRLRELLSLDLSGTQVGDRGLVHLVRLRRLSYLKLAHTSVTDVGVQDLKRLGRLRDVDLEGTSVSAAAREDLIRSLPDYGLDHIDDAELAKRVSSGDFAHINLSHTRVTDDGLKSVRDMTSLESLRLAGTSITDEGLKHLKGLANLKFLVLSGTGISDDGLRHLTSLTNLQSLSVCGTRVTEAGVEELKSVLPNVEVHRGGPPSPCSL